MRELLRSPVAKKERAPWRQRLVDTEKGFRVGIRADSTLFVYFFCSATVILTSFVLRLTGQEWAVLILALGGSLTAELLHQLLKQITLVLRGRFQEILLLGTAAVMVAHVTAAIVSGILLWHRISLLWGS